MIFKIKKWQGLNSTTLNTFANIYQTFLGFIKALHFLLLFTFFGSFMDLKPDSQ